MLLKKRSGEVKLDILTLSPKMAPPVNGLDGSNATMPTVRPPCEPNIFRARRSTIELFPEPGGPVIPSTNCFLPAVPFPLTPASRS
ncbi:MAG: hypothetical protein ACD_47C00317G0002 [uncultured bacterium]|nr:MAG: hypothetical protein ACD_47C00317G0002 [uncultured bacterium]